MTRTPKFLFDECSLGQPSIKALVQILGSSSENVEIAHVIDKFGTGAIDEEWIPEAAKEGYIIITADAGKHRSKGEKLPVVCEQYGVTHVIFSQAVNRFSAFGRRRAIADNWENLLKLVNEPKGSRFSIRVTNSPAGGTTLVNISRPHQS